MGNYSVVVLDFETTGLSPNNGDRAIEIGAVLIHNNEIIDRFESLMNPKMRISGFIEGMQLFNSGNILSLACYILIESMNELIDTKGQLWPS